ncbi:hypothetical protein TKK_0015993 [Trichogramma kaykai]|uniref:ADP-ribosylhydrolase ARH3 n=1 Tax=Trichogramma kaykai TaxID=54128 RepID=A0ABD2W9A2_9HYME
MTKIDLSLFAKKFRGSFLGVLTGDCLGSPYENEKLTSGMRLVLQKSFDTMEGPVYKAPVIQYTDDSAMTKSVAESLIEKKDLDLKDLAMKFVKSYYLEPNRGYGSGVVTVFQKLRGSKFADVLLPAKEQFNGGGSFGNGAAMRVAPISMFCYNNYDKLIELAQKQSLLTHTHKIGVDGAILQAMAIQQSLHIHPEEQFNVIEFVDQLLNKMKFVEIDEEGLDLIEAQPYTAQLKLVKNLLLEEGDDNPTHQKVIKLLGNDISGLRSVPTAIFCFLRAQKPISGINTDNPYRRALQYAISLGGDADTIGSMTGAIAGALYGIDKIPPNIIHHCEASDEFCQLADNLLDIANGLQWNL